MKKIVLHIGTGKTGTSSIQNFLLSNRKALREKFALDYPDYGLVHVEQLDDRFDGHYGLVNAILQRDPDVARNLAACVTASRGSCVVFSCENFYHHLQPDDIRFLAECLASFSVEVVCYVRRQDSYVESAWKQQIKVGEAKNTFEDYLSRQKRPGALATSHANYYRMLCHWRDAFGIAAIRLRIFDRAELVGGDVVDDFIAACGLPADALAQGLVRPAVANVALPSELMRVLQRVNEMNLVDKREQLAFVEFLRHTTDFRDQTMASFAERRALLENFAASNEQLFATFLGKPVPASFTASAVDLGAEAVDLAEGAKRWPYDLSFRCLVGAWELGRQQQAAAAGGVGGGVGRLAAMWRSRSRSGKRK